MTLWPLAEMCIRDRDKDEERVNAALAYVTNAQIGDSTNPQFIEIGRASCRERV